MSEGQGTASVEVRRVWRYEGEDETSLHIELAAGDETLPVHLKVGRNPRMFEFISKHSTVSTEPRPAKAATED